ncbi:unnamed protein product [Urochloa humidicola]
MAELGIEAARWMVGKALGPASSGLLEAWAASTELGTNIEALRMELLYAEGMLNNTRGRGHAHARGPENQNPALTELLRKLGDLAYRADDVLDELEYFRIQDELDGTYHAAEEHGGGCLRNHALNARHTVRAIAKVLGFSKCSCGSATSDDEPDEDPSTKVSCLCLGSKTSDHDDEQEEVDAGCMARITSGARGTIHAIGKHLPCYSNSPVQDNGNSNVPSTGRGFPNKAPQTEYVAQAPKLKFDRVEMSRKMKDIVEQLKPLCAKVSTILNLELLDSNRSIAHCIGTSLDTWFSKGQWPTPLHKNAMTSRPVSTPEFGEPELYGREHEKSDIVYDVTKGRYSDKDLTILPIVGPGGIGKTTLTQYIYKELENHFEIKLWVCVSVNFNVYRLKQEIADKLKQGRTDNPDKLIEEQLKSKRFLLVLDDMWNCSNVDEWNRFLVPFTKGQRKGSVVLVTTRFPALAQVVKTTDHWKDLKGLDEEELKKLFTACVFDDKKSENEHSELLETIGYEIVKKLKGSPLAAKTVGRLLRNHLDLGHWTRVLESKEWESQNGDHDIMPALKLSFDHLPFHLQQCFTYSALFPEDYKFSKEELIHFWIGLDVLHSRGENKRIEDIGLSYLSELVNHGFFKKEENEYENTYYIIHDLLHDLAIKVSAEECLSICSSNNVRSLQILPSIRHLSINIDESSVKDRQTFDICKEDYSILQKRLKVDNLHSLMLFGEHQGSFVKTFHSLFSNAKALRVIFISGRNYCMEDLFHNFSKLVHLRYLRITGLRSPKDISRFYHLRVLDVQKCYDCDDLPRYMSNLVKLRHFLVESDRMHSSISNVGRFKSLQELREFGVRKQSPGFELRQIGHLLELCGSLSIDNLENIEEREEAEEAKLMHKKRVQGLILNWNANRSSKDPAREEQILEGLKPHSNLLNLSIRGHGGASCPSWLGVNLLVKNLQYLCLDGVDWKTFPSIGELQLVNEAGKEISSNILNPHFKNLKMLELKNLAKLERWVVGCTNHLLSQLELLTIEDCPELVELSFPNCNCTQHEQKTRFPRLQELSISSCPKLSSLPPIPWTSSLCFVDISTAGLDFASLEYKKDYFEHVLALKITGKDHAQDMTATSFWTALDFDKLTGPEKLELRSCPPMPLDGLRKLSSTIKSVKISDWNSVNGKELTRVISCISKLSELSIGRCEKITGLGVMEQLKEATPSSRDALQIDAEGLLLLPPQLQTLCIWDCPELSVLPDSPHGESGGGLQGLTSLHSLTIQDCRKFLACYPSTPSSSCFPFPKSLQSLFLQGVDIMAPLSNLASLVQLWIQECGSSGVVGLGHLLAHGCLRKLSIDKTPNLFPVECSVDTPEMLEKELSLWTDDVAGILTAPVCRLLSSSLTQLFFWPKEAMERFTEEQDEALQLLTSLQRLDLSGCKLQCLPSGLQKLRNLEGLGIPGSPAIHSLHKDSLPDSLQELVIHGGDIHSLHKDSLPDSLLKLRIAACSSIRSLPKDGLPNSLQELEIFGCPSIRALPKGDLPSSLQLLDVSCANNSRELRKQCRRLIGTIPIVKLDQ